MEEPGTIAAFVAAMTGAGLAIREWFSYRASQNGARPLTESRAKELIEPISKDLTKHIEKNDREHTSLFNKVGGIEKSVAHIEGKMDH